MIETSRSLPTVSACFANDHFQPARRHTSLLSSGNPLHHVKVAQVIGAHSNRFVGFPIHDEKKRHTQWKNLCGCESKYSDSTQPSTSGTKLVNNWSPKDSLAHKVKCGKRLWFRFPLRCTPARLFYSRKCSQK